MIAFRWRLRPLAFSIFVLGTVAAGSPASAGSFKINPVNLSIPADRSTTSLTLTNTANEPVSVRAVTYRWSQPGGQDVYNDTNNVIVSPPIFTLGPGQSQLVRVGLRERRSGEAYRVVFEEIPSRGSTGTLIQVALRLNLPLFVETAGGKPNVQWQAWRDATGQITLEASNSGTRYQKVLAISTDAGAGRELPLTRETGVVLPTSSRKWVVGNRPELAVGSTVTLEIRTPTGEVQRKVVVQQH
jgi:fimbrial chaperone protein